MGKWSIGVIDDDDIYQMIMHKLICRTGLFKEKKKYCSAVMALEDFQDFNKALPDIILLDINMPEVDGWQFIERMRKLRPGFSTETRIYVVTSSIASSDVEKARTYEEIFEFLSKPLSVAKLKEIGEALDKSKSSA
ncbi:response regulator [Zunongwangia sp. F363]|uniref:Response regulator n=1 Tax=Autumnicola tepida TaxID=3075595 RepID=A0ABU3CBG9_9FLAO|nr:response regulator [Zunongwangia sp. F363]MDT0643390.1 response regulator [Zunongwangia sp. F363]